MNYADKLQSLLRSLCKDFRAGLALDSDCDGLRCEDCILNDTEALDTELWRLYTNGTITLGEVSLKFYDTGIPDIPSGYP